jgi:diaminopimelate epimerase
MRFHKYHALGNDYIVIDPGELADELTEKQIRTICHRNYGIGSDGILLGPMKSQEADFALRIFNPDGSEAEKSGNGLRIFARYLWDQNAVRQEAFSILTPGGCVEAQVNNDGVRVTVDMGRVSFDSSEIPVSGSKRQVINETMTIDGENITFCAATIGNPHCVILCDKVCETETRRLGPVIERDERFPNRTNVQFTKIMDRANIRIEIWERGAGYTLASGSSSCAAAAVARKLGLCDSDITVHMPGGRLNITVSDDFSVQMTGPVTKVADGLISQEMFG